MSPDTWFFYAQKMGKALWESPSINTRTNTANFDCTLFSQPHVVAEHYRRGHHGLEGHVQLIEQTYAGYLNDSFGFSGAGALTDFLTRRNERLLLGDTVDLGALVEQFGAPLEVSFCPQITTQVQNMLDYAMAAQAASSYTGSFLYAYATKANFSEEVVRTALNAGAHYETSAAADVVIAHHLWRQGVLAEDRYIFCNGSKEPMYLDGILALRQAGYERVVAVLDDLDELDYILAHCRVPMLFGVRERHAPEVVDRNHAGAERFGLTPAEMQLVAQRLAGTQHQLVVYHAMVGSQIEDAAAWEARLARSANAYAALASTTPSLTMFNFGGGMPTSGYDLAFQFDYVGFLTNLMANTQAICVEHGVAAPMIIAECGRYTVANHNLYLIEVGRVKEAGAIEPWYLLNGSLMVSAPDTLIVDQEFVVVPLDGWDTAVQAVRLGGRRTCDSDDLYPRSHRPALMLPEFQAGMVLAVCGVGAYQAMIGGKGGAHHCLNPEMRRIIIEQDGDQLVMREIAPQNLMAQMSALGYSIATIEQPVRKPMPARTAVVCEQLPVRPLRTARRRQAPSALRTSRFAASA